ncbi:MAG: alpha/beta hydrolase [Acidiferrobacterales bacterium]
MVGLIAILVFAYALIVVIIYFSQSRMIYLPEIPSRNLVATPERLGMDYENVWLRTADNVSLHGWYVPAKKSKYTLLFFHGNAGNISHRLESLKIFNELGLSVLIIDYRGYGNSGGRPTEAGTYEDARAAWQYLVSERGMDEKNIILFGRSLGAAIAAQLATVVSPGGIIVESAFTSTEALAKTVYWYLPVKLLTRIHYPTAKYISRISSPILVIHSRQDEIVPFRQGRQLFDLASKPKRFLELRGGHNEGFSVSGSDYINGLDDFIKTLP